jgi:inner membrane protein
MKWINHTIIAGSLTAIVNPLAVPSAILGGIAPDLLEKIVAAKKHRAETHYLIVWLAATLFTIFVYDFNGILFGLAFGGLTHILADSLNVSGVPFAPWAEQRFHLMGGKVRFGSPTEYAISFSILILSCVVVYHTRAAGEFSPFFYHWGELYQEGIIDGNEWRMNRLRIF